MDAIGFDLFPSGIVSKLIGLPWIRKIHFDCTFDGKSLGTKKQSPDPGFSIVGRFQVTHGSWKLEVGNCISLELLWILILQFFTAIEHISDIFNCKKTQRKIPPTKKTNKPPAFSNSFQFPETYIPSRYPLVN